MNQDGIRNEKQPTPEDLKLIANRYALTQRFLQQDFVLNNKALLEGFREADKDLRNMLLKAAAPPKAKPQLGCASQAASGFRSISPPANYRPLNCTGSLQWLQRPVLSL